MNISIRGGRAAFRRHGVFSHDGTGLKGLQTGFDAWLPGGFVAKLGRASDTSCMAGHTNLLVQRFTGACACSCDLGGCGGGRWRCSSGWGCDDSRGGCWCSGFSSGRGASACRYSRFRELATSSRRHVNDGSGHFDILEVATALRRHVVFALESRIEQCRKAGADTRRPGRSIAKLGRTHCASGVAGRALNFIDFFAGAQRAVAFLDLNHADFLDALGDGPLGVVRTRHRLAGRSDVKSQTDNGKNSHDKRQRNRRQKLLGCLDRAVVGRIGGVFAHGFLKKREIRGLPQFAAGSPHYSHAPRNDTDASTGW